MAKRILVIDDDAILAGLLQLTLQLEGYDVETAEDGEVGLARVRADHFDLILLDLVMPNVDGIKFLRLLRESSAQSPPVMIVSSATDGVLTDQHRAMGVIDIARKPVEPSLLVERVAAALSDDQPAQVAQS